MSKDSFSLVRVSISIFFFSGFAALIFVIIWFKQFIRVWGSSTLSQAVVAATFFFGLALGAFMIGRIADQVKSPLTWYCLCEIAIGLLAMAVPYEISLLRKISSLIYPIFYDRPFLLFCLRFTFTFLVIGPACILMGGTLPLLMKHFLVMHSWNRETTGLIFAVNTLGAAFGGFCTGFYLLPGLGMIGTNQLAVAINFYVVLLVYLLLRHYSQNQLENRKIVDVHESPFPLIASENDHFFSRKAIYASSAITGCALSIMQMVWTRNLTLILGGTTYAFSVMLFVFLLGISMGSTVYSRTVRKMTNFSKVLSIVMAFLAMSILMGKLSLPYLAQSVGFMRGLRANGMLNGLISMSVCITVEFFPSLCMGFLFPFFVDILRWRKHHSGTVAGNVYAMIMMGCILGTLMTPSILITVCGSSRTIAAAIFLYGISFMLIYPYREKKSSIIFMISLLIFISSLPIAYRQNDPRLMNLGQYLYGYMPTQKLLAMSRVLYFKEGSSSNIFVIETGGNRQLRVNGIVDAGDAEDMPVQMGLAYYPRLFCPDARDVLIIGYGNGTTAGCSLMFPKTKVTCCEIEPAVVEAGMHFSQINHRPEPSRNFRLVMDDGRSFLVGCNESFDLILSEPSNLWAAGISNLFTQEFYEDIQAHLRPQGVFSQRIQTDNISSVEYNMIVRTLLKVFSHCALIRISTSDAILLASDSTLSLSEENIEAAQQLLNESPNVMEDIGAVFAAQHVSDLMLRCFMLPEESMRRILDSDESRSINTDINMRLEFSSPLLLFIPAEWQEKIDEFLICQADPEWWIQCFQKWNCNSEQIYFLKLWIRIFQQYDYMEKSKILSEFAIQYAPDDPFIVAQNLFFSINDPNQFNHYLNFLMEISVDEVFSLGIVLRERQHPKEAAELLERIVEQRPTWTTAWTHLALCYVDMKNWALADGIFSRAFELDPDNPFLKISYDNYHKLRNE